MVEFLKHVFSNFWMWLGFVIIIGMILNFIFKTYNRALRHRHIMKYGYPPSHCDADGEFRQIKENEKITIG
jgi:hypothetical protein